MAEKAARTERIMRAAHALESRVRECSALHAETFEEYRLRALEVDRLWSRMTHIQRAEHLALSDNALSEHHERMLEIGRNFGAQV